ncbi:uncharacterized protein LOC135398778 [Ornithodoros turicata]|uniref:uncharacterized protein LOC135398778 n=1 Tax=Ornithodoros turicata TaxID=34597 RepID=UPI00313A2FA4
MGCANGKVITLPMTPKNGISPIEVTDGVERMNNLINQPPPKVVISGDFLEETSKIGDMETNGSGHMTGPDILNLEEKVDNMSQEVEFLSPPEVPPDDDKVAMVDMIIEDAVSPSNAIGSDNFENDNHANNNQQSDNQGMDVGDNNNEAGEDDIVVVEESTLDDNGNDTLPAPVEDEERELTTSDDAHETKRPSRDIADDLLVTDEE